MPTPLVFRPTHSRDLDFCWPIYRDAMQPLTPNWQEAAERRLISDAMSDSGTWIVRAPGAEAADGDAGWLQVGETRYVIHLAHLYLTPSMRQWWPWHRLPALDVRSRRAQAQGIHPRCDGRQPRTQPL